MNMTVKGNFITIIFEAGEPQSGTITLPDGYSIDTIYIDNVNNLRLFSTVFLINSGDTIHFPPVNSKSPSCFLYQIENDGYPASIRFLIEKFGQIPTAHYFDKAFEPILVKGDDGNEYKVIPSDQFK